MSDALSIVEIDGQHVELLPARTVLSLFSVGGSKGGGTSDGAAGATGGTTTTTNTGGEGGDAKGKALFTHNWFYTEGDVYNTVTGATGGAGGTGAATSSAAPAGGAAPAGH